MPLKLPEFPYLSRMYREIDFQDCLSGLVGWRQNVNPDYPTLPPALIASASGLYFQDEHPLVNIENIDQADKNYDKFNFPAYSGATPYSEGNRVRYLTNNEVYESIQDANTGHLPTDPVWWIEVSLLAQKLDQITRAAATKLLSRIFVDKKLNEVTKSIFENIQLFDGSGSLLNKEVKQSRFVGFEIFLKDNRDVLTVIRKLGTQFSQINPAFPLYIYHSSQVAAIFQIDVALTKALSFEWTKLLDDDNNPILFKYLDEEFSPGGCFYVGYYEDDLIGQAINKGYDFGIIPTNCGACNNDYRYWSAWSQYVKINPFSVQAGDLPGDKTLWDINRNQYDFIKNWGLNMDLTVKCDVTDFLCRERTMFADCLTKQVAIDVLQLIAYSTRNNVEAKQTRDMAMFALNNKDNYTPGAEKKLEMSLKALSFDISDLNDACLPCNQKYGANWTTI